MKKKLLLTVALLFSTLAISEPMIGEPIRINMVSALGVNHMKSTTLLKQVELINATQSTYKLFVDFKPGADGRVALMAADASPKNTIVGIGSYYINHTVNNKINGNDYVYVERSGHDICAAINTNVGDPKLGIASLSALAGQTIVVGTNAIGDPGHLTALQLSKMYNFNIRVAIFKTPIDAYHNMVGNHGVNLVFLGPPQYLKFKDKNKNLKILGMNCDIRSKLVPDIKTVKEQGFSFPRAFGFMLASRQMPAKWRSDVGLLLAQAYDQLPKNPVLMYSTDPNWFDIRVAEQKEFLKQAASMETPNKFARPPTQTYVVSNLE